MSDVPKNCAVMFDPHPDDADWWTGGLTCMLVDLGWDVHYVCVGPTEDETRANALASAELLGVQRHFWEIRINGSSTLRRDLADAVFPFLRERQATLVFVPSVTDYHQEHVDLSRELLRTLRDRGRHGVGASEIYAYDSHENREPVEIYLDITSVWDRHIAAMQCHHFFDRPEPVCNTLTSVKSGRAQVLGTSIPVRCDGVQYAEGYRIIWGDPKEVSSLRVLFPEQFFYRAPNWLLTM